MAWPMPEVRHFLACLSFHADPAVREFSLLNVLYRLRVPGPAPGGRFGVLLREVHLIAQLSDAEGTFGLTAELVRLDDEAVIARGDEVSVVLPDKLHVYNFHRCIRNVPFGQPGAYEFRLHVRQLRGPTGAEVVSARYETLAHEPLIVEVV